MSLVGLYGASGHAKVLVDIVEKTGGKVSQIVDDNPLITQLLEHSVCRVEKINTANEWIIAVGNNQVRKNLAEKIKVNYTTLIHPRATVSSHVSIGKGTVLMAHVVVNSSVRCGAHVILNTSCRIDHDCELFDYVHISPGATLCGNVIIGEGAHIGAGAVIVPGVKIGAWATIGAGAVIIKDVPDFATVVGNPGKIIKIKSKPNIE